MDKRLALFALSLLTVVASSSAISACSLTKGSSSSVEETPYIASNGNWWIGNKDLGVGATGSAGTSPSIGENGNWWIGTVDTGVSATGSKGVDGTNGVNGTSCHLGEGTPSFEFGDDGDSYIDTVTYDFFEKDSGLWKKIGNLKGSNGINGSSGKNGLNGKDGSTLLVGYGNPGATLSSKDGDSYIDLDTYSLYQKEDGSWHLVGVFKGTDGKDGTNGSDGKDGATGEKGDKGDKGDTGAQGDKGDKGDTGSTGAQGEKGDTGAKGDKGDVGASGEQGEKGDKGDKGDTGAKGETGEKGDTGATGVTGAQGEKGDTGDKGDKGDTGLTGATGEQGEKGDKGDKGDKGATGAQGETGEKGATGATGSQGAQGEKGDTGDKGDKGDTGATGSTGEQGEKGDTGATGKKGDTGDVGEKGDKGDKGATGAQGEQGEKGDKGDTGATGATGAQGDKGDKGDKGDPGKNGIDGQDGLDAVNGAIAVSFYNYDGSLLQTTCIPYGGDATYKGTTPTKPSDGNVSYIFNGWGRDSMSGLIRNSSFTAQYSERSFTGEDADFTFKPNEASNGFIVADYSGDNNFVVIPSSHQGKPVTSINSYAFAGLSKIEGINLPSTITSVGAYAFASCKSLRDVVLHSSFPDFSMNALFETSYYENSSSWSNDCLFVKNYTSGGKILLGKKTSLFSNCVVYSDQAVIDEETEVIATDFFSYNDKGGGNYGSTLKKISSLFIPKSVQIIGNNAFKNCKKLKEVTFEAGSQLASIGNNAFNGDALATISFPEGLKRIGQSSFYENPLVGELVFPSSLEMLGEDDVIGNGAFEGIVGITSVSFFSPSKLKAIGTKTFSDCSGVKSLGLPASFSGKILASAFAGCNKLPKVFIPDGVTEIQTLAFQGCSTMTNLRLPSSLTTIGSCAFDGCTKLKYITYNGTKEQCIAFFTTDLKSACFPSLGEISVNEETTNTNWVNF
jgi:hypothetical protein